MAASFSSSSSFSGVDPSLCKYDVFISFSGVDAHHGFILHLYSALCRNRINAYIDEARLDYKDDFPVELPIPKAIEESEISIIVFSTNYSSSTWCLDELVHILKCQKVRGQIVLPIFYGIDRSDVREQKSSYADAFVEYEQRFNNRIDKVQERRQALIEASGLSGWDSRGKSDSELVEAVVQDVVWILTEIWSTSIDNSDGLLGGAFLSAFVEDLFCRFRSQDFLKLLNGKEPIPKLLNDVETKLLSTIRVLNDAEEKQLTDHRVKEWLDRLKEEIFRADDLTENIDYEVLIRKLRGASESSTSIATFGKSSEEEMALEKILSQMKKELGMISFQLERLVAQTCELGLKVLSLRSHGEPLVLESDVYGREDDKEATMKLVRSDNKAMVEAAIKAFKPDVYGGEDAKMADLNAHPDLLPVIGEETGGIGKTNLGEYLNAHPDLQGIGEEIVNKCKGHPIAVKSVVALLYSIPSPDEWRKILENHIWDLKLQENTSKYVLPALWLSYRYLSPQLKRCFAYCSIFPKDYEFTQKEVILLWMAEGFLQPKGGTRMEDVGEEYFKILTSRSLFQQLAQPDPKFIMHDCVHDLATFVLGDFGCRLEDNNFHNLSSRTRHMFVWKEKNLDSKEFEALSNAKCLRTFLSSGHHLSVRENIVLLKKLLMEKGCLRVLSLYGFLSTSELPDSVGNLKHLRYLNLSSTSIKEVPATVCTLYNLETLLLLNCRNLTQLPTDIGCLIKLRHLDFSCSPIKELPPQICDMKDLQTLSKFILCREHGNSWIKKLGDFQQLHGEFDISGLENVVDVKNVSEAKMRDKKFLTELGLYWDGDHSLKEREILDQLQPHTNLKALRISGYKGASFSNWMGDQSFTNIARVFLLNCENLCSLSPLEQLPSLKLLYIMGFRSMETIKWEFSSMTKPFKSLESLKFWKMAEWKEWLFSGEQIFPSLKELEFDECPKLDVVLPDCFPSLTKLRVEKCRKLMPLLIPGTHQRFGFPSLQELRIWGCPEQEFALEGGFPSSLKKIFIFDCDNLKALDDKGFRLLTSLQSLNIEYCKELQRLPEELPTYPFDLVIAESPLLESRCNENGEDWPKIKHTRLSVNKVKLT